VGFDVSGPGPNIPEFIGDLWYVDAGAVAGGTGTRTNPFSTIADAIAAAAAGDGIYITAGTYDEDGLNLNLDALELHGEIGAVIANTTPGTVLTVSADFCKVEDTAFTASAGQTNVVLSGVGSQLNRCFAGPSAKDFFVERFAKARPMRTSQGLIMRAQNGTDGFNGTNFGVSVIYED